MDTLALTIVIATALFFTSTNGFHDSAGAISTSVSTRALTPRVALALAAFMNLAGAFLGTSVADTVTEDLIVVPDGPGEHGMLLLFAALLGAVAWNLLVWRTSLPSSSTHALLGGLLGAALAAAATVHWDGVLTKIVIPMAVAPLAGLALGYAAMLAILWLFRNASPRSAQHGFRIAQTVSTAGMALGHGLQDAQKTMGVVVMALIVADVEAEGTDVPVWVRVACAAALALGTYAGGWRVMRTLGRRVIALDPPRGFAAESASAGVLYAATYLANAPVSTTHVLGGSIMGVGATRRFTTVRWGVARTVLLGWLLTLPATAGLAALAYAAMAAFA
ncbi:inorganic phosphate transporter [Streptomyces sp. 6N223]|uniref:inorganic phosphate transporter n=1 Tax=Streptomyces sp. 6N223 TaxID=3457412 RepID=UPI003FCF43EB